MKRIRRTPRGNRCDKSQDSQGILLFVLKMGKIAIFRQPPFYCRRKKAELLVTVHTQ